jgi:hypothetical protein
LKLEVYGKVTVNGGALLPSGAPQCLQTALHQEPGSEVASRDVLCSAHRGGWTGANTGSEDAIDGDHGDTNHPQRDQYTPETKYCDA